ncbi:MAG TPA: hypothetical protein IAC44_06905 [Candidatus Merdimorpha stercoravium]|uniref:Outer membrane lipoprotein-sorting protein n=1 Tax=Candidatus Merdimorpha stercoravium TaxID=2840863 RepID=A0A9D1HCR6_9FLAO|nr:hypothetical protein [Candidatus Merdimorpha stercoravium]
MKKTWIFPAAAALLLVGCAQNEPKDAMEVLGQYETATGLGGLTKDTPLMLKLRMDMSDSTKMNCTLIVNPPQERLRLEMTVNGQTAVFAVDGQQGWMLPPDGSGVQTLPKEQIEAFSQQFNALSGIKWDTADYRLTLLPSEKKNGKKYNVVEAAPKQDSLGQVHQKVFFNRETGLADFTEYKLNMYGQETSGEVVFGAYEEGQGVKYPSSLTSSADGKEVYSALIDTLIINYAAPDSLFVQPSAEK